MTTLENFSRERSKLSSAVAGARMKNRPDKVAALEEKIREIEQKMREHIGLPG